MFLLGLWAGRKRIFVDTSEHRRFFRQLLTASGLLALVSTALVMGNGGLAIFAPIPGWRGVVGVTTFDVHQATLSAFYVAGVTLLF